MLIHKDYQTINVDMFLLAQQPQHAVILGSNSGDLHLVAKLVYEWCHNGFLKFDGKGPPDSERLTNLCHGSREQEFVCELLIL